MKLIKVLLAAGIILFLVAAVMAVGIDKSYKLSAAYLGYIFACWCGFMFVSWLEIMEAAAEDREKQLKEISDTLAAISRRLGERHPAPDLEKLEQLTDDIRDDVRDMKEMAEELRDALGERRPAVGVRVEEEVRRRR